MNKQLLVKLNKARLEICIKYPFLGFALQHYNIYLKEDIKTACTDGINIYFGKDFLENININDTIFVLLHELIHILLKHPEHGFNKNKYIYNIACDIVVNDTLSYYGIKFSNQENLIRSKMFINFNIDGYFQSSEQIYNILINQQLSNELILLFSHELWNSKFNQESSLKVDKIFNDARNMKLSENELKLINSLTQPKISNYTITKFLSKFLVDDLHDFNYSRVDKRYSNILLPEFSPYIKKLQNIWFLIDVSGSMLETEIIKTYQEISRVVDKFSNIECKISFFSTIVTKPVIFKNKKQLIESYKGIRTTYGTSFSKIFEMLKKYFKIELPSAIIILTDGLAKYPNKEVAGNIPVLWVINNNVAIDPPFGKVIRKRRN